MNFKELFGLSKIVPSRQKFFCPVLVWTQKANVRIQFSHQVEMKNVVKSSKNFFGYFNTLETHNDFFFTSIWNIEFHSIMQ